MKINTLRLAIASLMLANIHTNLHAAPRFVINQIVNQTSQDLMLAISKKQPVVITSNSVKKTPISLPLDTISFGFVSPSSWKKADDQEFTQENLDVQSDIIISDANNSTKYELYYELTKRGNGLKAIAQLQTPEGTTVSSWQHDFQDLSLSQADGITLNISLNFIEKDAGSIVPASRSLSVIVENLPSA